VIEMAKSGVSTNIFYVYVFFRMDGSPCYVGKGHGDRWFGHESCPVHANTAFNALLRDAKSKGLKLPKIKIAQGLSQADAFAVEIAFISALGRKSLGTGCLTNLTDGGEGESGKVFSPASREKMRQAKLGRTLTPEHKAAISRSSGGRVWSLESREKNAASQRLREKWTLTEEQLLARKSGANPGHTGHRHTEAVKQKLSAERKGVPWSAARRLAKTKHAKQQGV
jgi:hypothetical protein